MKKHTYQAKTYEEAKNMAMADLMESRRKFIYKRNIKF